jgi:hypothetical protein
VRLFTTLKWNAGNSARRQRRTNLAGTAEQRPLNQWIMCWSLRRRTHRSCLQWLESFSRRMEVPIGAATSATTFRTDEKCENATLMLTEVSASGSLDPLNDTFASEPGLCQTLMRLTKKCIRVWALKQPSSLFDSTPSDRPGLQFCRRLFNT